MYRNAEMVSGGGVALVAFVVDRSPGATGCVRLAAAAGITIDRTDFSGPLSEPGSTCEFAGRVGCLSEKVPSELG